MGERDFLDPFEVVFLKIMLAVDSWSKIKSLGIIKLPSSRKENPKFDGLSGYRINYAARDKG